MADRDSQLVENKYYPTDIQLIQAIRHDLANRVAPELTSDMAKDIVRMAADILDRMYLRGTIATEQLRARVTEKRELATRGIALLAAAGETFDGAVEDVPADDAALHGHARAQDRLLTRLVPQLMRLADRDPSVAGDVKPLLAGLVQGDDAQHSTAMARASEAAERFSADRAASEAKVTQDQLQDYLRRRFPDDAALSVASMRELPGGFGKTTILFDVDGLDSKPRSMVIRRDRSAGATEATVLDEYPLLEAVQGYGLPAPEPLWLEADPAQLGLPFLVVGRLPGKQAGSLWAPDPALCTEETARDLARIIAKLHSIPIETVGSTGVWAPEARANAIEESINYIDDLWQRTQMEPDPVMDMCLQWLRLNQPPAPEKPVLVHSDIGFHNLLVDNQKISGLLDWELAHPGDANEDLCYVRPYVEQLMPWADFVAEYISLGGQEYKEDRTEYYGIWRDVRNAIFSGLCHRGFCTDANSDIRFGHAGMLYLKMMTQTAANRILSL